MANIRSQEENKAKSVQTDAANANSVPALRGQVVKLAEVVEELKKK